MLRRAILILILIAGVMLVFWSGWHNLRDHRMESARINSTRVTLVPDNTVSSAGTITSSLDGKPAPPLTLKDISGKDVSLSDFKGHPMLLNFWGTYCAPCKIEMPWLQELSQKYAPQGFDVIGITFDSEVGRETIAKDTQKLGVTYPILLSNSTAEKEYLSDTDVLPVSFYVNRAGTIIAVTAGLGGKDELESMVQKTIASN